MNRYCPFCNKTVGNDPHIYFCVEKSTSDKREIKFLFIKRNFPEISDLNLLERMYINKSLPDIKREFGIDFKSTLFLLDYFKIKKRNISESSLKISGPKYKKTCIEKYGVDNVSKVEKVQNSKKSTFFKNYGVDNIFKDSTFKKWISENNFAWNNLSIEENRDRVKKQTKSIKKFWNLITDEKKNEIFRYENHTSKLETKVSESLINNGISFTSQFLFKGKIFDFKITDSNILIEVNGDYWHCNPKYYNAEDYNKHNKKAMDIWNKDKRKKEIAELNGYRVIYIWEDEIKSYMNLNELVFEKLAYN